MYCNRCKKIKPTTAFYVKAGRQTHSYCKDCVNEQTLERQRARKDEAIKLLGGKCQICGGVFHPAVYDFHHKDPDEKDFSFGHGRNLSMEKLKIELEKCILVCANCHRTLHAKY